MQLLTQREQESIKPLAERTVDQVDRALAAVGIEHWQRRGYGCLVWLQWARRLNVPVGRVAQTLVQEYRRRLHKAGPACGVAMNVLISTSARDFVFEQIPSEVTDPPMKPLPPFTSAEQYQSAMQERQRRLSRPLRAYRGSVRWSPPVEPAVLDAVQKDLRV